MWSFERCDCVAICHTVRANMESVSLRTCFEITLLCWKVSLGIYI